MAKNYSIRDPRIGNSSRSRNTFRYSSDRLDEAETGPTQKAIDEWLAMGLELPDLPKMRKQRLDRLVRQIQERNLDGVLLFDPLNIRYATDSTNMQVWTAHDFARAAFVSADGYLILWDFDRCGHLTQYLTLIDEVRTGASAFYFARGDKSQEAALNFAKEVKDVVNRFCDGRCIAIDKSEISVAFSLREMGIEIFDGMEVLEHARLVKNGEEIKAMRCAIAACESAVDKMYQFFEPGISEVELWSHFHAGNIERGGEWIETRLVSSGPRTNPWMQEAGPRILKIGDLLAFDTDMVGPYGFCCDMSRTWLCGDVDPTSEQQELFKVAHLHILENIQLLRPGTSFRDLSFKGHQLPSDFIPQRYCVKMHGVGLCDEFPSIYYPEDYIQGAFDYEVAAGMVFSVEVYTGRVGGRDGVKLEDQVLVTENGYELLTQYPYDQRLLG